MTRMAGDDYQKRERVKMLAWVKPKQARRKLISGILQLNANFIFCFRAKSVSKPVKAGGKTEVVPQGFVAESGEELIFEQTCNILLLPKSGGIPTWQSEYPGEAAAIKLPEQFRGIFAKPKPLDEDIGRQLAEWAGGGKTKPDETIAIRDKLEAAARQGTDALKTEFERLTNPQRKAQLPEMDRLKKIAKDADDPIGEPPIAFEQPKQREPGEEG